VVCLLGMNDGDFPRRAPPVRFRPAGAAGMARPGDRSRRDDDRYLMLEALLAARDKLYVSWVGRNVRDNSEQPASVLVSQLRDYLAPAGSSTCDARTTVHALQPFSRRYFEQGGLLTYAGEWRAAHARRTRRDDALPPFELEPDFRLKLANWPASCASRRATSSGAAWASLRRGRGGGRGRGTVLARRAGALLPGRQPADDDAAADEAQDEVRRCWTRAPSAWRAKACCRSAWSGKQWQRSWSTAWCRCAGLAGAGRALPQPAPKLAVSLAFDGVHRAGRLDRQAAQRRRAAPCG
jgi:exodeoxyribonuclease V gamma subunit